MMKNPRGVLFLCCLLAIHTAAKAQSYYQPFKQNEVSFAAVNYKIIQVSDSMNRVLNTYFAVGPDAEEQNFAQLLYQQTKEGALAVYGMDNYFSLPDYTKKEAFDKLQDRLGCGVENCLVRDENTGEYTTIAFEKVFDEREITSYLVQQLNFFKPNKQVVASRIIGICPIREYTNNESLPRKRAVGWYKFADIQDILSKAEENEQVKNRNNSMNHFFVTNRLQSQKYKIDPAYHEDWVAWMELVQDSIYTELFPLKLTEAYAFANAFQEQLKRKKIVRAHYTYPPKAKIQKPSATSVDFNYSYQVLELNCLENCFLQAPFEKVHGYTGLANALLVGLRNKEFKAYAYSGFADHKIGTAMDSVSVENAFGRSIDTVKVYDDMGNSMRYTVCTQADPGLIKSYVLRIKEYTDSNPDTKPVIDAILPVLHTRSDRDPEQWQKKFTFWVKMDEAAPYLNENLIYKIDYSGYTSFYDFLNSNSVKLSDLNLE